MIRNSLLIIFLLLTGCSGHWQTPGNGLILRKVQWTGAPLPVGNGV
jgi:hypothetical protein